MAAACEEAYFLTSFVVLGRKRSFVDVRKTRMDLKTYDSNFAPQAVVLKPQTLAI